MYATCLFCHASLGANESIEHFPVGKRLAFDAAKGRLWVVCTKCERWNLSPLDERWEAIEEAERAYRDPKKRVATDNVGLSRLNDGTDLIRIGAPLRPEFAAWRYGDTFGRRRTKQFVVGGSLLGAAGLTYGLGLSAMSTGVFTGLLAMYAPQFIYALRGALPAVTVCDDDGALHRLSRQQISWASIGTHCMESNVQLKFLSSKVESSRPQRVAEVVRRMSPFKLQDPHRDESATILRGAVALRALSAMLPTLNVSGASERRVSDAAALIENTPSATTLMSNLLPLPNGRFLKHKFNDGVTLRAGNLPAVPRLALEMTLHEDDERRALEGELHVLEQRWRDADEIARIADSLTLPDGIVERVAHLHSQSAHTSTTVNPPEPEG